jgi:hypothetical protein
MTPSQLAEICERDAGVGHIVMEKPGSKARSFHHDAVIDRRSLLALVDSQSAEIARLRKVIDWGALEIIREAVSESNVVKRDNMHQIANRMYAALTEIAK